KLASTNNSVTKNGIKWTGSVSGDLEVGNATFGNTEDYTVSITLVAQEGYSFDIANLTAEVNAREATVTGTSEEVTVSYTFEKAAPTTHKVYFNPSLNGSGTMETVVVNEGAEYTLPECTFTPNTNYEFSAWSISGVLKKPGDVIVVNSDENVFAVWQSSSTPASFGFVTQPTGGNVAAGAFFTASFEVDNGINYNDVSVLEYDEKTGNWNTYVGNSGYIHTIDNGKIIKIGFESDDTSSKILRLSAVRDGLSVGLSDTFTVNWTPSEFTKQPHGATVINGETYTFTWDTTFDARFRILYWNTEKNDWDGVKDGETTGHSFSVKQDTTQSITYKVVADIPYTMSNGNTNYVWEVATSQSFIVNWVEDAPTEYIVAYGPGEGEGSGDYEYVEEGTEYTLDSYENAGSIIAPEGKQFAYWSIRLNSGMGEETAQMQAGGKITITADTYIIAIWEDIPSFTVSFNSNGGSGNMASVEDVSGNYTLPANGFTAPNGKQFKGWALSENGEVIATATINVSSNTTLYAIWEDIPHAHSLEAIGAKAATCTAKGNIAYWHCSDCDKYFSDENGEHEITLESTVLEKIAHTLVYDPAVPATCTESGLTAGSHCSVCGTVLISQEVVPALGHDFGEWQVVTPATETEEGLERRVCSRDANHFEERTIPVIGHVHTIVAVEAKAADCEHAGNSAYYECSACHRYFSDVNGD
ncbi:MAG: InlB B-repeat-containing protein, partial [Clostridia bacterium]|nr:InlB B-repeat-containing protein [Clostridia bacterium]